MAVLLHTTGRTTQAAELYEKVLSLEPNRLIALNNLAWILCQEQGKYQQALELAQRGLADAPNYVDLIDTCGMIYYHMEQYDKAVQKFTRCINLYPQTLPALTGSYFHLGSALERLGRKNETIKNLQKALELNTQIGGLPHADLAQVKQLLEKLTKESDYAPNTN